MRGAHGKRTRYSFFLSEGRRQELLSPQGLKSRLQGLGFRGLANSKASKTVCKASVFEALLSRPCNYQSHPWGYGRITWRSAAVTRFISAVPESGGLQLPVSGVLRVKSVFSLPCQRGLGRVKPWALPLSWLQLYRRPQSLCPEKTVRRIPRSHHGTNHANRTCDKVAEVCQSAETVPSE